MHQKTTRINGVTGAAPGRDTPVRESTNIPDSALPGEIGWSADELAALQARDSDIGPIQEWLLNNTERPGFKSLAPYSRESMPCDIAYL